MDRNEIPYDPGHLGVLSGVSKAIFEPVVRSAQTVHLSCVKNRTISKQTEMSIHLTHVTWLFYQLCPKRFSSYGKLGASRAPILLQY
jgi:hypothetical protein